MKAKREINKALSAQFPNADLDLTITSKGHILVRVITKHGVVTGTFSGSASDFRSMKNTLADMRRDAKAAGIEVK